MLKARQVKRQRITITVDPDVRAALLRLNVASGTSISRLIEEFLRPEVLNSISEGLERARAGEDLPSIASKMSGVLGQHIAVASKTLKDFQDMGNK